MARCRQKIIDNYYNPLTFTFIRMKFFALSIAALIPLCIVSPVAKADGYPTVSTPRISYRTATPARTVVRPTVTQYTQPVQVVQQAAPTTTIIERHTERTIKQIIERPVYVDRVVEKVVERPVYIERVVEKPVVIERPVYIDRVQTQVVTQPVYVQPTYRAQNYQYNYNYNYPANYGNTNYNTGYKPYASNNNYGNYNYNTGYKPYSNTNSSYGSANNYGNYNYNNSGYGNGYSNNNYGNSNYNSGYGYNGSTW